MPVALITRLSAHTHLSEDDTRALERAFSKMRAIGAKQEILPERGRTGDAILVTGGIAARFKTLKSGKRQIVGYTLPGDFVEFGPLESGRASYGVTALGDTTISRLSHDGLAHLMRARPAIDQALWRAAGEQMSILCEWISSIGQRSAEQRLAHLFCEQYFRMRDIGAVHDGVLEFPLTQRDLADSVGTTNVHVNRVLQQMRLERLIVFDGAALRVLDLPGLIARAEFDPDYLCLSDSSLANGAARPKPASTGRATEGDYSLP
jgi:CRP-like cAMP-binding protein